MLINKYNMIDNIEEYLFSQGLNKEHFNNALVIEIDKKLDLFEEELSKINADKSQYYICGGFVKTFYNLRTSDDIDYIIDVKQGTNINMIKNPLFSDFGLSQNFCEEYYNSTNPKLYKKQQKTNTVKKEEVIENKFCNILCQTTPFSCSGLKINVYWSLFRQLLYRYHKLVNESEYNIYCLKEFIDDKNNFIQYRGFNIFKIEFEFIRDEMKRADLKKYSQKHINDIKTYIQKYSPNNNVKDALLFNSKRCINYNFIYLGSLNDNGGTQLLLRKTSNQTRNVIAEICKDFQPLILEYNTSMDFNQYDKIYDNILLTSILNLPLGIRFKYILYINGGITIYLPNDINEYCLYNNEYIMKGDMTFELDNVKGKILYNIDSLPKEYNLMEYKLSLTDLMRTVLSIHKTYDKLCSKRNVMIEYSTKF